MIDTKVYFRVRPESSSYAPEDFESLEDAVTRCNERNVVRHRTQLQSDKGTFYKGHNCKLQKVTITVEEITF